jgi:hypothetical protein
MAAQPRPQHSDVRPPPHSVESEQAVLGGLMLDNASWAAACDVLVASDFYRHDHQLIFNAIADLLGNDEPADAVTVSELLASKELSHSTGGLLYLAQLVRDTPSAANVGAYAAIIRERSTLRSIISLGGQLSANGYDPEGRHATELLAETERKVIEIGRTTKRPQQPSRIEARPFEWRDPATIPPRQWLYARHYMRGMVSATAGIGGAGKSTLLNVELVSMAIGRDLLNDGKALPGGPMSVWGHNGEDPYEELQRRLMAVCKHYGVTREDLAGRLRITSGRDMPIMVATEMPGGGRVMVPTEAGRRIGAEITRHQIQVFVADPFVTMHSVSENDNTMIDGVMGILRDLADSTKTALELAHHFRKMNGDEASIDAVRGAGAIVGAARSVRIVSSMSKEDAQKCAIDEEQRGFYSWLQNGKANMLPPTHKRRWLRMHSVSLGNAREPYEADEIGVVTAWEPPQLEVALSGAEFRMIRTAVLGADPIRQLRADIRSTGWIGHLLANVMQLDPKDASVKAQMQSVIAKLLANGCLVKDTMRDLVKGRPAPVMRWSSEEDSE